METPLERRPGVCFEVEKIIGVSCEGNIRSYQVQWAPAWVSGFQLTGCEHLIQEFLQEQQKSENHVVAEITRNEKDAAHTIAHSEKDAIHRITHNEKNGARHSEVVTKITDTEKNATSQIDKGAVHYPQVDSVERNPDVAVLEPLSGVMEHISSQDEGNTDSAVLNNFVHVENSEEVDANMERNNLFYTNVKEEEIDIFYQEDESTERATFVDVPNGYNNGLTELSTSSSVHDDAPESTLPDSSNYNPILKFKLSASDERGSCPKQRKSRGSAGKAHRNNQGGVHLCSVCGQQFPFKSQLAIHFAKHSGVRRYVCTQCGKGFTKSNDLKRHMRGHTGAKPYTCEICIKSFTRRATLRNHLTTHHPDRPHVCTQCLVSFSLRNDLETHLLLHSRPHRD